MKIYTALQIGDYHQNYCEDYLFTAEIGNNKLLCAVMDGCTMGTDSYFVATLVGKLLRKIAKELEYQCFYDPKALPNEMDAWLKTILRKLFHELNVAKNLLMLDRKELLTTLVLLLVDKKADEGLVLVLGDGWVSINGIHTEFDQENKPDYLGFHLSEDFDYWYSRQTQKIRFSQIRDISIATDGMGMFAPVKKPTVTDTIVPVDFLLVDKTHAETEDMLGTKLKKMEHTYGLKPTDDLAVIRIIT